MIDAYENGCNVHFTRRPATATPEAYEQPDELELSYARDVVEMDYLHTLTERGNKGEVVDAAEFDSDVEQSVRKYLNILTRRIDEAVILGNPTVEFLVPHFDHETEKVAAAIDIISDRMKSLNYRPKVEFGVLRYGRKAIDANATPPKYRKISFNIF